MDKILFELCEEQVWHFLDMYDFDFWFFALVWI